MGIPRLLQRLKDAGHVQAETFRVDDTANKWAIIDGPSLAHFIARALNITEIRYANVGSGPTYKACNDAVIHWLDQIQSAGFMVEGIFFDGALPQSKRPIRLGRLTAYALALESYKNIHDAVSRTAVIRSDGTDEIWSGSGIRTARRNLAPQCFLVPAVVEALLTSKYADKVYVVPGEADAFCVAAAQKLSADSTVPAPFIFTSDSDLAVFESGVDTKIIYFHGLDLRTHGGKTTVTGEIISTSQISRNLGLPNLLHLAYLLEEDPHLTIKSATDKIRSGASINPQAYQAFVSRYSTTQENIHLQSLQCDPLHRSHLCKLDARLSEVIHQIEMDPTEQPTSYLPFLLENPSRSTAYYICLNIRQAAYTLLIRHNPSTTTALGQFSTPASIIEWKRSASRIVPITIPLLDSEVLTETLQSLLSTLSSDDILQMTITNERSWRSLVLRCLLYYMAEHEIKLPPDLYHRDLSSLLITGGGGDRNESQTLLINWETTHFYAMYQAVYYSLRMLKQALGYLLSRTDAELSIRRERDQKMRDLMEEVKNALEGLPSIAEFLEQRSEDGANEEDPRTQEDSVKGLIERVQEETGFVFRDGNEETGKVGGKRKRKKRNKGGEEGAEKKRKGVEIPTNPFALLAGDMDEKRQSRTQTYT